jgi:hypothetical protein
MKKPWLLVLLTFSFNWMYCLQWLPIGARAGSAVRSLDFVFKPLPACDCIWSGSLLSATDRG